MKSFLLMIGFCGVLSWTLPILPQTEQATEEDTQLAQKYLNSYYPEPEEMPVFRSKHNNIDVNKLRQMQEFFGLKVTGKLDSTTLDEMKAPRCGVPDIEGFKTFPLSPKWPKKDLTYSLQNYTPDMARADVEEAIRRAWKVWSDVTPLTFTMVSGDSADILILFGAGEHSKIPFDPRFDGPNGEVGHAFSPAHGGYVHFDEDEDWTKDATGINLFHVAAHEFGHSLGLSHTNVKEALMFPKYIRSDPAKVKLHQDDIEGIQSLYGPPEEAGGDGQPSGSGSPTHLQEQATDLCNPHLTFDAAATLRGETLFFKDSFMWRKNPAENNIEKDLISAFWPALSGGIDAAYEVENKDILFLFKGEKYWATKGNIIQPGFPKNIHTLGFPRSVKKIDAAVYDKNTKRTLFFSSGKYWRYDETKNSIEKSYPRKIAVDFPDIGSTVDAALQHNGHLYLFSGSKQYEFYSKSKRFIGINKSNFWIGCQ
ncbi:interstitial collagenase-like [Eublepharis macularius]|uniref:Interstitial collagenase-like n=1 Tax=Eublepharis macularius TaxID=481883 RepID=A0AA97J2B7_EUBMA|nr:interstitial collagenase-like [Eublepharis macularius]